MIRRLTFLFYILIVLILAAASIVEHFIGTPATQSVLYGSWWFVLLWVFLVLCGSCYLISRFRRRRIHLYDCNTLLIHLSFIIILAGALLTHTTSSRGIIYLRSDQPSNHYEEMEDRGRVHILPFSIRLDRFRIDYHNGTSTPMDYETRFVIMDGQKTLHASVSMNHIFTYRHYRICQASYDTDCRGSYLSISHDPWGIGVTYTGYGLLFVSLILLLVLPGSSFRQLLRSPLLRKGLFTLLLLLTLSPARAASQAEHLQSDVSVVDKNLAANFGRLYINYNGRICPVQTFALDFTQKIYGSRSYHKLTAEQVLVSWIFFPVEWSNEPFIHVKNAQMRTRFGLDEYASLKAFFPGDAYVLGPALQEYQAGNHDAYHKACIDIDNKLQLIMFLRTGLPLQMIPFRQQGTVIWYSPADSLPQDMPSTEKLFVKNVFPMLYQPVAANDLQSANTFINQWRKLQVRDGGASLPSSTQLKAELLYNAVPIASILFMANLLLGLICLGVIIHKTGMQRPSFYGLPYHACIVGARLLLFISWASLTLVLILRGIISGTVPMANGYETMLLMAWLVMLFMLIHSLSLRNLSMLSCAFGFLLSGFFLLVSHINQMDPAIGHVMPVLNSPLLSIHVSIIMISFALLAVTFVCGVTGLLMSSHAKELQALSRLFLYPAITTLAMGIFIGAIWANVSWGSYWTWDPKETWALITLMVYAIALHTQTLPALQRPRTYHLMMTIAFLTIIMTYFGVNYFLEGMHSYA